MHRSAILRAARGRTAASNSSLPYRPTQLRSFAAGPSNSPKESASEPQRPYEYKKAPPPPQTLLAQYLRRNPRAMTVFQSLTGVLGMGNPRQVAGRVSYHYYQDVCANRDRQERDFWFNGRYVHTVHL